MTMLSKPQLDILIREARDIGRLDERLEQTQRDLKDAIARLSSFWRRDKHRTRALSLTADLLDMDRRRDRRQEGFEALKRRYLAENGEASQ